MRGSIVPDNELAINNDELYAKRILENLKKKNQVKILITTKMGVPIVRTPILMKKRNFKRKRG